jgi:MinD superfamily P-loop ATPase
MIISIASGKGGTGKTTFSVNLAHALADRGETVRLLDCDVEEPNGHLFVQPTFSKQFPVKVMKPAWDEQLCNGCGECAEACHFNAIAVVKGKVLIFNELCHACGVCAYVCPEKALVESPVEIGHVQAAPENQPFFFAHGILNVGEAMAPAVIQHVKKYIDQNFINIVDASPGTSCPVVETVSGSDVTVLVTEPTPFGLNDLKLAVGLALKEKVPTGIVVNCSDGRDDIITEYADRVGIPVLGRIPYNREYAVAYSSGQILVDRFPELKATLLKIFDGISALVGKAPPPPPRDESLAVQGASADPFVTGDAMQCKEIAIISGKGGSGKTTVVSALAMLAQNSVLADNDVDAADLHLLLKPTVLEAHDFVGGEKAMIDAQACIGCGACAENCHFGAIRCDEETGTCQIDELACEGCGMCQYVCEVDAVTTRPNVVGQWYISNTHWGPMVHARLAIAEENSGRLVTQVRGVAAGIAKQYKKSQILCDGPPGSGCPVIAAVSGADQVLIVTEPTVSGVHDMQRVLDLSHHFGIPVRIVINKADLNIEQSERIEAIAREKRSRVIAKIPYDRNVNDALIAGKTVIEHGKGPAFEALRHIWQGLRKEL